MRVVRSVSENEVIAAFLRGEIESERFGGHLIALLNEDAANASLIIDPDLSDQAQNDYRLGLLDRHRGWARREGLFRGLPTGIDWSLIELAPDEALAIRYIDWDWWVMLSGGTRAPVEAAGRLRAGEIEGGDAAGWEPAAARLRSDNPAPPLIAVSTPDGSSLVLVEGHVRLTAFALFPEYLPELLPVYLGTSPRIEEWCMF